ncbi:Bowman-Birk type trypsin inhibitor TI1 isoform X2 [Brachypodium distachyon]|uniref:Bowman-Birk serine protease inhibitors family domain-containing protein n=1 Tax=Brachypodium distachyon TaxID=15368 RepID=I1H1I0_BRADI|nr:Bowman-Birk type trypsin inhibitor TI1 isoform X2 [Brachypodium distachyon]KQK19823.1 hypothetical protein BRADI_1g50670v3 [Brachypodium distachyon]|eukprot:XP_014752128.1 Bowman-Birk type trypsin inhibitor TI1 isoform X2 [Brachypodium distachyon]
MKRGIAFILVLTLSLAGGRLSAAAVADVAIIRLPAHAGVASEGEEEKPWKCCDLTICARSFPPTCRCADVVKQCADGCKSCMGVPFGHICNDWYTGDPAQGATNGN